MRIREAMTRQVRTVSPSSTIREAARAMADLDVGALPVSEGDRLIGMITDRDIAIRAIAAGKNAETTVGECMSPQVMYCFEDEAMEEVAENMADIQVRRLPVVNRDKRLVGIVSLADLTTLADAEDAAEALRGISRPGGLHTQSADGSA
jgi:CBS domain-containing protein